MSDADEIERIIDTLNTGGLIDREDVAVYFGHLSARIAELEKAMKDAQQTMRNAWGAVTSNQIEDKGVAEMLKDGVRLARTTLEASEKK